MPDESCDRLLRDSRIKVIGMEADRCVRESVCVCVCVRERERETCRYSETSWKKLNELV